MKKGPSTSPSSTANEQERKRSLKKKSQTSTTKPPVDANDELSIDNLETWIEDLDFIDLDEQKEQKGQSHVAVSAASEEAKESASDGNTLRRVMLDAPAEICRQGVT